MDASSSLESLFDDDSDDIPIPSRSPSRLDFCMDDIEDEVLMRSDSPTHALEAINWDTAFFEEETFEVAIAPDHPHLPIVDSTDDEEQTTDSPSENADTAQDHPMDPVTPEPVAPTPIRPPRAQLYVDTDAPEHVPFSSVTPPRLQYPHRGFSRSALQQRKTLWNSRHEEWARYQQSEAKQSLEEGANHAYTGLATPHPHATDSSSPVRTPPPSGLERDLADHPPKKHEQDASASIFPRVGDISALRDPYAARIDRSFFMYPLWTIQKALYVFDMHQRSTSCAPSASVDVARMQASSSSSSLSSLSSYASSVLGNDVKSDSTLVADDSPMFQTKPLDDVKCASFPPFQGHCGWYRRWELLIDLFQHQFSWDSVERSMPETPPPPPPLKPAFHFHVGEDDEEDDEEEDYGTVIAHSSFNVDFEEECRRAMAFYKRAACGDSFLTRVFGEEAEADD